MSSFDYDLFTIGAGSGGVRASRISASYGARVAVAEESDLGGTCVNLGCIPKKLFVYASHFRDDFEDAAGYGWSVGERSVDWSKLLANKDREIARLNEIYRKLLSDAGVDLLDGRARVVDPHTVEVAGKRVTAENILVATGGRPVVPEIPGIELAITSNEAFHLSVLPERAIVVGGGYISVEFAGIFHGLGVDTTQLYRGPLFLRGFDDDLRQALASQMRSNGLDLRFDANIASIAKSSGGLCATLEDGSTLEADVILYATGRSPNTREIGLEEAGVALNGKGAVSVDEFSRSSVPSIWAIGDATDRINLTPVAIHEGMCLASTLFADQPSRPDHSNVASAVFSQPPIGTVGLAEAAARDAYGEIDVYRSSFRPLKHTLTGRDEITMMKLVVDRASDRVVGVHMLGPEAGEIIQGFAVALKCGATKAQFDATIGIHPTLAEEFVTLRDPVG
jgi:glutathione reductase (NADPH)